MRAAVLAFAAAAVLHLAVRLLGPSLLAGPTQILLMPLLALVVMRATSPPPGSSCPP